MSINRWMDKEDVVHIYIYNGILLSHRKEWNWVICSDVDAHRVCHSEWSKSEREKQILHFNIYIYNLEKWYRWTYLQGRNRDADLAIRHVDTGSGKGTVGQTGRAALTCTHSCVKHVQHRELGSARRLCDDREGWDVGVGGRFKREGYMCTYNWYCCISRNQHKIVKQLLSQWRIMNGKTIFFPSNLNKNFSKASFCLQSPSPELGQ